MPVIVLKEITLRILTVRAYRIACQVCHRPFNWLSVHNHSPSTTGIPVISSKEAMAKEVSRKGRRMVVDYAKKDVPTYFVCPHCGWYQPSALRTSWGEICTIAGVGAILGLIVVYVLNGVLILRSNGRGGGFDNTALAILAGAGIGGLIGLVCWYLMAPKPGAHPKKRSGFTKTDEEMQTYLQRCREHDAHALLSWYVEVKQSPDQGKLVIPLGFRDCTGDAGFFPDDLTTDAIIAEAEADEARTGVPSPNEVGTNDQV